MSDLGNKEVLAKNLNYYMTLRGKDRNDICNDLGFKYTTLTDWVTGKKYPRIDKIEILANYFGILKSDLIENKTSAPAEAEADEPTKDTIRFALSGEVKDLNDDEIDEIVEFAKFVRMKRRNKEEK